MFFEFLLALNKHYFVSSSIKIELLDINYQYNDFYSAIYKCLCEKIHYITHVV